MNWKVTCTMGERTAFIEAWLSRRFTVTELCIRYGVSRKTGYKWIARFKSLGMTGLEDASRARHSQSHQTADAIVARILELKNQYPDWGPVTIRSALYRSATDRHWPQRARLVKYLRHTGWLSRVSLVGKRHRKPSHYIMLSAQTTSGAPTSRASFG
ncbi:leucine zipper domain-containing protein [Halopseudomonas pachastrellae]|nr:leucine zipper domain-containing protein [Halopseudomonas pachastrellae]